MRFDGNAALGREYGLEINDEEVAALCEVLHSGFSVNMISLHVWAFPFESKAGAFPKASEVVRQQIAQGQKRCDRPAAPDH